MRAAAGSLAALALALASPAAALDPPVEQAPPPPAARLAFAATVRSGSIACAAGLMCMPDGRVRFHEFVPSEIAAAEQLAAALAQRGLSGAGLPAVTLERWDGKLCMRGYGVFGRGDRQTLSGKVTFHFAVTRPGEAPRQVEVMVTAEHGDAAPATDIFARALMQLAGQIAN